MAPAATSSFSSAPTPGILALLPAPIPPPKPASAGVPDVPTKISPAPPKAAHVVKPASPFTQPRPVTEETKPIPKGERVLTNLLRKNAAFVRGLHKIHSGVPELRTHLAKHGQTPTTCVIACADSRVSPEILFHAGLGELFVIRAAGNTTWGNEVLGSIEYAVDHLNISLVMVLGHSKCGAVGAAVAGGDPLPGALGRHVGRITKGLEAHKGGLCSGVEHAVEVNVRGAVKFLRKDADGCVPVAERRGLKVVGAVYDISNGEVRVLKDEEEKVECAGAGMGREGCGGHGGHVARMRALFGRGAN